MNRKILDRRLECLNYAFSGVRTGEWVPIIATKYGVSESGIWNDWSRRPRWISEVFTLDEGAYKVSELLGRLELALIQAYRLMVTSKNESVKIGAARTVESISKSLYMIGGQAGVYPSLLKDLMTKLEALEEEMEELGPPRPWRRGSTP